MNDKPDYMSTMLDKLVLAGWVEGTVLKDQAEGSKQVSIKWTANGHQKMMLLLMLVSEIERASSQISNEEMPLLKGLAQLASMTAPPAPPEPPLGRR